MKCSCPTECQSQCVCLCHPKKAWLASLQIGQKVHYGNYCTEVYAICEDETMLVKLADLPAVIQFFAIEPCNCLTGCICPTQKLMISGCQCGGN